MDRREIDYLTNLTLQASSKLRTNALEDVLKEAFSGVEVIDKHVAKEKLLELLRKESHGL